MKALSDSFHSGRTILGRRNFWLTAVTITMGALGAWSEVNAGKAAGKKILTRSLHVSVHPGGANA